MSALSPRSDIASPTSTPRAKHRVKFLTVDDLRRGLQRNHVPVLQLFSKLDTNQDGRISVREARVGLRRLLATLGYDAGQSVVTRLFHRLDKDNSGFIDYAEFHRAIAPRKLADPPPDRRSIIVMVLVGIAAVGGLLRLLLPKQDYPPLPPPPPSPSQPPSAPPPLPPQPPASPMAPPFELSPAQIYLLTGAVAVVVAVGACAALPTRKLAKPAALADLDEPADVYQWTSSGGLVLRMRLPRRIGKPKGEWYIDEDPHADPAKAPAPVDDTAYCA